MVGPIAMGWDCRGAGSDCQASADLDSLPLGVSTALMFLLGILDFLFVSHAYHSILTRGASVQVGAEGTRQAEGS